MIIVTCKHFPALKTESLFYSEFESYINSIEYIDNQFDEIIIRVKNKKYNNCYDTKRQLHNPIDPAFISYHNNGIQKVNYFYKNGSIHRENGPAIMTYYDNGMLRYKEFRIDDIIHRLDGPAEQEFYENGKIKYCSYLVKGKRHRLEGPASIYYYINGEKEHERYYINGREYLSKKEFKEAVEKYKNDHNNM